MKTVDYTPVIQAIFFVYFLSSDFLLSYLTVFALLTTLYSLSIMKGRANIMPFLESHIRGLPLSKQ